MDPWVVKTVLVHISLELVDTLLAHLPPDICIKLRSLEFHLGDQPVPLLLGIDE